MPSDRRRRGLFALLTIVVIVGILYLRGVLDPMLYRFGLNHNPCAHSASGSIICGSDVAGTPYGLRLGDSVRVAVTAVELDRPG